MDTMQSMLVSTNNEHEILAIAVDAERLCVPFHFSHTATGLFLSLCATQENRDPYSRESGRTWSAVYLSWGWYR